ncbi:MAG: hypothetical protein HY046_14740 [Acidobacteria bacterium]|nr:hypothetical protein [Acidobacteriota bacterium]
MPEFPILRWLAVLWLIVWVPAYWHTWGCENFLLLCDLAVFLTCFGLLTGNSLLLSSQAVSMAFIGALWALDLLSYGIIGKHIIGGTGYLWDPQYPLWVRALSVYHILLPVIAIWALRRVGYDKRGWRLQSALAIVITIASRWGDPAKNLNFAFTDPIFQRAWGPAPAHLAFILVVLIFAIYYSTHVMLGRFLPVRHQVPATVTDPVKD